MTTSGLENSSEKNKANEESSPLDLSFAGKKPITASDVLIEDKSEKDDERIAGLLDLIPSAHAEEKDVAVTVFESAFNPTIRTLATPFQDSLRSTLKTLENVNGKFTTAEDILSEIDENELSVIKYVASQTKIPVEVLIAIRICETGGWYKNNYNVTSLGGAVGRFQHVRETARGTGYERVLYKKYKKRSYTYDQGTKKIQFTDGEVVSELTNGVIQLGGHQFTMGRAGDYFENGKFYPAEDERLGIASWFATANILVEKYIIGRQDWIEAAYNYNGDVWAQDEYKETFKRALKGAHEWQEKTSIQKSFTPTFNVEIINSPITIADYLAEKKIDMVDFTMDTVAGPLNNELSLFRIPLSELGSDIVLPPGSKKFIEHHFLLDGNSATGFAHQLQDGKAAFTQQRDGTVILHRDAFKKLSKDEWHASIQNKFGKSGDLSYVQQARGTDFPPTLDDLRRSGFSWNEIMTYNKKMFGFSGNPPSFNINNCDPGIREYLQETHLRKGYIIQLPEKKGSKVDMVTLRRITDSIDDELFAKGMFFEGMDKKVFVIEKVKDIKECYKLTDESGKVGTSNEYMRNLLYITLYQIGNEALGVGPFHFDPHDATASLFYLLQGEPTALAYVQKYLSKRAEEKLPEFLSQERLAMKDVRWVYMIARFWNQYPPKDMKLLGDLLTVLDKISITNIDDKAIFINESESINATQAELVRRYDRDKRAINWIDKYESDNKLRETLRQRYTDKVKEKIKNDSNNILFKELANEWNQDNSKNGVKIGSDNPQFGYKPNSLQERIETRVAYPILHGNNILGYIEFDMVAPNQSSVFKLQIRYDYEGKMRYAREAGEFTQIEQAIVQSLFLQFYRQKLIPLEKLQEKKSDSGTVYLYDHGEYKISYYYDKANNVEKIYVLDKSADINTKDIFKYVRGKIEFQPEKFTFKLWEYAGILQTAVEVGTYSDFTQLISDIPSKLYHSAN